MRKDIVLIFMLLWTYCIPLSGQESLNHSGAVHLGGSGAFQTSSYDFYKRNHGHLNLMYSKFFLNNVFIGGQFSLSMDNIDFNNFTMYEKYLDFTLGPVAGYMFGNENSKVFPYVKFSAEAGYHNLRVSYFDSDPFSGTYSKQAGAIFKLAGSLGVLVPLNKSLALNLEAGIGKNYLPENEVFQLLLESNHYIFYSIGMIGTIY